MKKTTEIKNPQSEIDQNGNCIYCGQRCFEGEGCDEYNAGGFTTKQSYVEPVGFKGTKWEWNVATDHDRKVGNFPNTLIIGNGNTVANCSPNVLLPKEEREANAKLISQSKEIAKALQDMIELAQDIKDQYSDLCDGENVEKHWQPRIDKAEQVLKDAGLE